MTNLFFRWGVPLISLAALCVFGWGTYLQIKGQGETNQEMRRVAESVQKANELTSITAKSLQPLVETAKTMQAMNRDLAATGQLLKEMNDGLARVTSSERRIVANLTALNQSIGATQEEIGRVSQFNGQLVSLFTQMKGQVRQERGSVHKMNGLTMTSIGELRKLNEKFAVLRALP